MPDKETLKRARKSAQQGKSPSTQAGEFVREEIKHVREGRHGARSPQQAIAIGLSKARRAGVKLPPRGRAKAARDYRLGQTSRRHRPSRRRSRAISGVLRREHRNTVSRGALSHQGRSSARRRGHADLVRASRKALRTKGPARLRRAARKAARTRKARRS
jgi:hypothetical protein